MTTVESTPEPAIAPRNSAGVLVGKVLGHPVFLLVLGAAVSSLLIPAITRGWQNHEKQLQIKTGLVTDMSSSLTTFLMAIQFAEVQSEASGAAPKGELLKRAEATFERANQAYYSFEVSSA